MRPRARPRKQNRQSNQTCPTCPVFICSRSKFSDSNIDRSAGALCHDHERWIHIGIGGENALNRVDGKLRIDVAGP
jgi:hypothetical protein